MVKISCLHVQSLSLDYGRKCVLSTVIFSSSGAGKCQPDRGGGTTHLIAHERYHTGERSFPCSLCNAAFTDHGRLVAHQRGAHKIARRGGQIGWANKKKKSLDNG